MAEGTNIPLYFEKICAICRKDDGMLLAGLDIGTTGCKVAVYSANGDYLGKVYQDYPVQRTTSEHEVDAKAISDAVKSVIRQAAAQYPQIGGIGVTSFGETFVLLDEKDEPLLPAMLYTDPRGCVTASRSWSAPSVSFARPAWRLLPCTACRS